MSEQEVDVDAPHFDEVAALQLIPIIIYQMVGHQISNKDQAALIKVYGSLWPLIVKEADRLRSRSNQFIEMDLVLKEVLRAQQVQTYGRQHALNRRSSTNGLPNDQAPFASKLAANWDESNVHVEPSQRILKMAAVLIREHDRKKQVQTDTETNFLSDQMIEIARQNRRLRLAMASFRPQVEHVRKRRSLVAPLEDDLNNDQVIMLRSLLSNANDSDDYDDFVDEYNELDDDRDMEPVAAQLRSDNNEYDGYAFDMAQALVEDDDALLRRLYGTSRQSNEGSIMELLKIAAQNRRRAE